jgi:hypothetical protein
VGSGEPDGRPPGERLTERLTEAQLYAQLVGAIRGAGQDLLRDPAVLARGLDERFRLRPHIRLIGRAFAELAEGVHDRLLIITPPQVGKSTAAAEWGPFWWLIRHPAHRVVVASYGDDLAFRRGRKVRGLVTLHGAEFGLRLSREFTSVKEWELDPRCGGGGMRSVGVGSGITGHSADILICDDPHKNRAEAESLRTRDTIHDWWTADALYRLQPGSPVVLIQTRWHVDDLAGRVLADEGRIEQGGRWKVLHLPAIADRKFGDDPLGRAPGQPLTHPKIPTRDVARLARHWADKKRTSGRDWHSLAQGDPQPAEGALVTHRLLRSLRQYTGQAEPQKVAVAIDPSGGGRDVAGIIGGYLGDDGRLWFTHDRSAAMSSEDWSKAACRLAYATGAAMMIVETNYGGDMAKLVLGAAWERLKAEGEIGAGELRPQIVAKHAKTGKLLRAEPIAAQMAMDRVRIGAPLPDLEAEWTTWQPTDPDSPGRIDASVYLAYALLPVPGAAALISSPAQTSREQVAASAGGWTEQRIDRP